MTVALEAGGTFSEEGSARVPHAGGSRVVAVCGRDGVGKSKVCAALLELAEPPGRRAPAASPHFADKSRLLEREPAEGTRNFSCYNHIYSQRAADAGLPQRLHLIDTPGHVDRLPLVDHALRVAHGAIIVCSVRGGVNAACGRVFTAVERSGKPSVVFLNGIDEADDAGGFDEALDALEQRLGIRPVVLFAPAHVSGAHTGSLLLNVLDNTMCSALECSLVDVGAEGKADGKLAVWAKRLRDQQIKSLAAVDDEMMEAFAEFDGEVPRVLIESALRRVAAAGRIMPLIAGSAKSGLGIDALQEAVRTFIPAMDSAPLLRELGIEPIGDIDFSPKAPFLGWVFGRRRAAGQQLLEVRVLDGALRPEQGLRVVHSTGPGEAFAPDRLLAHGPRGELVPCREGGPGDLVLVPAPESLGRAGQAGFVLSDDRRPFGPGRPAERPETKTGQCTFALQVESLEPGERERLLRALGVLLQDDDGLALDLDAHTGEYRLSCMGALHLELMRERLAEEFQVTRLPLGKPRVAYCVTLGGAPSVASGGQQHEGTVPRLVKAWAEVELAPGRRGTGVRIEAVGVSGPATAAAFEEGIRHGLEAAGPGGTRVTDVRVRLLSAEAQHEEAAAAAAARAVERAVARAPRVVLLEPVVELEVDVPSRAVDGVVEDLRHRRGEVCGERLSEGESHVVDAKVPLREILDYTAELQKLSAGEGFFNYRLQGYKEVEDPVARHILEHEILVSCSPQAAST